MRKMLLALLFAACASAAVAQNTNGLVAPSLLGTRNLSAVIAAGNTFQTVLAAVVPNPFSSTLGRNSLTIQNNNATDACWIVIGGVLGSATKGIAISLAAGASYTRYFPYIPNDAIHGTCATTSDTLYIDIQ